MKNTTTKIKIFSIVLIYFLLCSSFVSPTFHNSYTYDDMEYDNCGYEITRYSSTDFHRLGVSGYMDNGEFYEDNIKDTESGIWGNSSFWQDDDNYEYYLDTDGQWWRSRNGRWQKWINLLGWHWSEVIYQEEPSNIAQQMYKNNPTLSLDESTTLVVAMASLAALAGIFKVVSGNRLKSKKVPL